MGTSWISRKGESEKREGGDPPYQRGRGVYASLRYCKKDLIATISFVRIGNVINNAVDKWVKVNLHFRNYSARIVFYVDLK